MVTCHSYKLSLVLSSQKLMSSNHFFFHKNANASWKKIYNFLNCHQSHICLKLYIDLMIDLWTTKST